MDEKSFLRGKEADDFACLMTDLDNHRILEVARGRSEEGARALIEKALDPVQQYMVSGVATGLKPMIKVAKMLKRRFRGSARPHMGRRGHRPYDWCR